MSGQLCWARAHLLITLQPLEAFFVLDGPLFASVLLAPSGLVSGPTLDIQQAQRRALGREGHRIMQQQTDGAMLQLAADATQLLGSRMSL